jgi:hypothetical protein
MTQRVYKKGDLVISTRILFKNVSDDNTGEVHELIEYEGIGIITDVEQQHFGWVKIWWQKHPFEDPENLYLVSNIEPYIHKNL